MAKAAGIPEDVFGEAYWANRAEYDKGVLTYTDYWAGIARAGNKKISAEAIDQLVELDSASWMHFDPVMWEWIDALRSAGKPVAMLSNMPRELGETLRARTQRLEVFDFVTLSYEVRSAKPEPAIYEHCLEGIGTAPDKTLFLDDRIANVQAAEVLGLRAIQFTNRDDVLLRIRA